VLEGYALDLILYVASLELAFEGDELPFLERLGELQESVPSVNAVLTRCGSRSRPYRSSSFPGGKAKGDVLTVVVSGFGFCMLSETADESDLLEHGVSLRFFLVCVAICGTCLPNGCVA